MKNDEEAIRELVDTWMAATRANDLPTVLTLMADDALFMVPGKKPFGKEEFATNSKALKDVQIDGTSEIHEIKVSGDWAWMRNRLKVKITPPNGKPMLRSGYTLTILRKERDGRWILYRDANLLSADPPSST